MNILKDLEALKKLLENKNYGEHLALEELVNILIKYHEKDWKIESQKEKVKPDMYSHNSIVYEDEIILSYLNSFAYTIKLWVESKQEIRISQTIDKFACIITAYLHGLKKRGSNAT